MSTYIKIILWTVLIALLALLVAINSKPVTFKFYFWDIEVSLGLLLVIAILLGWLGGLLIPIIIKKRKND